MYHLKVDLGNPIADESKEVLLVLIVSTSLEVEPQKVAARVALEAYPPKPCSINERSS